MKTVDDMREDISIVPDDLTKLTPFERKILTDRGIISGNSFTEYGKSLRVKKDISDIQVEVPKPTPVDKDVEKQILDAVASPEPESETGTEEDTSAPVNTQSATVGKPEICPNCGWDIIVKPFENITEEDKVNFIRHILGNDSTRFSKTVELLGGRLKVTFQSRTVGESEQIFAQAGREAVAKKFSHDFEYAFRVTQLQLACSLREIDFGGSVTKYSTLASYLTTQDDLNAGESAVTKLHAATVRGMSDGVFNMLIAEFKKFEQLYAYLQSKGLSPDFWNPTPGPSLQ